MHRLLLSIATLVLALAAERAPAAAPEPLAIDLHNNLWTGDLDVLIRHRAIRVLVPYSKTLYFVDYGGTQRGMSYEFMRAFEDALNQKLGRGVLRIHAVFIAVSRDQLIPLLLSGQGDVVAANLTITPSRLRQVDFVRPVASGVQEIIVTGPGAPALRSLDDLSGREIYVQPATSYFESLNDLNAEFHGRKLPPVRLMAAQGYQESQLDQTRRSSAGAIGVMQLTAATGNQMGVGDIGELEANIHAGIKYVRFMVDNYYAEGDVDSLNKVLFAIASYNAGPNRIRALRKETAQHGLNPNVWFDNVERLVAERIGRETVQYVSNIYKYYIAYTLVQEDVARNLEKSDAASLH